jgi:hypothetical protein
VGNAAAIVVFQDITSLHMKSEALLREAHFDHLTGLLNRAAVREVLDRGTPLPVGPPEGQTGEGGNDA